jgi:hypothetical protein
VPGWHKATEGLQDEDRFQMVGIIQEQHPDRARLFMQWKQMDWPIMIDSLDLLGVSGIPITLAIDEMGIIRSKRMHPESLESDFLSHNYRDSKDGEKHVKSFPYTPPNLEQQIETKTSFSSMGEWMSLGNDLVLWGNQNHLDEAVNAYQQALTLSPDSGQAHFSLGVALRRRYESPGRRKDDFQNAVTYWQQALNIDPNQYIWRRRIQQYGPRLDKPYSFYDWVNHAREEILEQGAQPVPLPVEPSGAEFAVPSRSLLNGTESQSEPDSSGRIFRDSGEFIHIEQTIVASSKKDGSFRVHFTLRPIADKKAHWNNESDDLKLWVSAPKNAVIPSRIFHYPNPEEATDSRVRRLEFEINPGNIPSEEPVSIPAYFLYNVCEDVNGTCLYRRQDISLEFK